MTQEEKAKERALFEEREAFNIPAPVINRFAVAIYKHGVRLTFVEEDPSDNPRARSAVFMSKDDAMALVHVLHAVLVQDSGLAAMSTEGATRQ